ncbi:MAG: DUF3291 domain-containing protein [Paracoccaceae bacterium]
MQTGQSTHIAEFNRGILKYDWDRPEIAEFQNNLDRVNILAARSDGFVWRMDDDAMEAAQLDLNGPLGGNPRLASTLSVWTSTQALSNFVHKTVHGKFMKKRDIWFEKSEGPAHVIWPVTVGHTPTVQEAAKRLEMLGVNGPTSLAYDFNWWRENALSVE